MTARAYIGLKTKLASALLVVGGIPHEHAKLMTEDQVLSLFQWHHFPIPHGHDGADVHHNLTPILIKPHRNYEAKIGRPMMAKVDRLSQAHADFRRKLLARDDFQHAGPQYLERGRKRRIQSRGFDKTKTRTFRGKVKPRKQRRPA